MHKFTVKRSEWFRGQGQDDSYLIRGFDEQKCCLGFYCFTKGVYYNTATCAKLMDINDSQGINEIEREDLLKKEFASVGIEVEFED